MIISKILNIIEKIIDIFLFIFFLFFFLIGVYALYDINEVYNGAKLDNELKELEPTNDEFLIKDLKDINQDIIGWIKVDDTNINYPLLYKKEDNNYYLSRNYKDEYETAGSIFLDHRNDPYFNDDYNIIYGHNMSHDMMFSDVKKFLNKEFFDVHRYGRLLLENNVYKIEIISSFQVSAFDSNIYNLLDNKNNKNNILLDYFKKLYINNRDINLDNSKLLLFSTCDALDPNKRSVLLANISLDDNLSDKIVIKKDNKKINNKNIKNKHNKSNDNFKLDINLNIKDICFYLLLIVVIIIFLTLIIRIIKNRR